MSKLQGNRSRILDVDGRTVEARRWRHIFNGLLEQAAALVGGEERLTAAHVTLLRRTTTIEVLCELMDAQVANGEQVDASLYVRLSGALGRLLERAGLPDFRNEPPDADGTLEDYLKGKGKPRAVLNEDQPKIVSDLR